MFAGSLFDLEPDTEYEGRFVLTDPAGLEGRSEQIVTVRTRFEPKPFAGGRVYVYPPGYKGTKQEPAFTGLLAAYYTGSSNSDNHNTFPPRVQPGDTILIHAGTYKDDRFSYGGGGGLGTISDGTYFLTQSGTPDKPIVMKAAGDGEVIFDGDGAHTLFDLMAASDNYFEGLTIRNTEIAFLAGRKNIIGSRGLTIKRCRFENIGRGVLTDWSGSKDFYIADNIFIGRYNPNRLIGVTGRTWQNFPEFPNKLVSEFAVKVYGSGNVVAHNYIANFHDGVDHATYGNPDGAPNAIRDRLPVSIDAPRHRELLILRTAWLCGNQYTWSSHAMLAKRLGLTADEIRRIAQGPDARGWDPFEATLLRLADQLYRNSSVNDATWKALAARYDVYHLMDAVMTVADFTTLAIMYNSMGVQPDPGVTERLPTDVPYRVAVPEREPALNVARVEPLEGTGIAIGRTFARYPKLAEPRSRNAEYVNRRSKLPPRYREMLILRIGWNCRSEYEWAQHVGSVGRARDYGLEPVRIAMGPDAPGWDPFEAMLLRAADELYRDAIVSDRTWNALAARFDTTMMMNVIVTASNYRMVSMALNALGVQLEPGNERFPNVASR